MESWKLDRICTWLMSGIGINSDRSLKYYIDKKDKILFNLKKENDQYIFRHYQMGLSDKKKELLTSLLSRVIENDSNIIELDKTGKYSDLLPINKSISREIREAQWNELGAEMRDFIDKNKIDIEEYHLIE